MHFEEKAMGHKALKKKVHSAVKTFSLKIDGKEIFIEVRVTALEVGN